MSDYYATHDNAEYDHGDGVWRSRPAPAADNGRGVPYGRSVYISAPWDGREVPPSPDPGEVERVARAMRVTRECQAGMAFGVPPDARDQFITALARAALAAARPATDAVTAPEGVAARLDELEALHAAALSIRQGYPSLPQVVQNETEIEADWSDGGRSVLAECYGEDVAEWLVAAANALPDLIAAVRAVAELVDEWRASIHILDEIDRFEVVRGIDAALSALSGRDDHTERQPCGCKSVYVHDHGCTKFASDHTEEADHG